MADLIQILKGTQPAKILENDLKKNQISQESLARQIGVSKQMINAIISGKRDISIELGLKIEKILGYEEGFLATLQAWYKIEKTKKTWSKLAYPNPPNIRRGLFWDYDFNNLDWEKYKNAIIHRVLERGNKTEKEEIARYYNLKVEELDNYKLSERYYQP